MAHGLFSIVYIRFVIHLVWNWLYDALDGA